MQPAPHQALAHTTVYKNAHLLTQTLTRHLGSLALILACPWHKKKRGCFWEEPRLLSSPMHILGIANAAHAACPAHTRAHTNSQGETIQGRPFRGVSPATVIYSSTMRALPCNMLKQSSNAPAVGASEPPPDHHHSTNTQTKQLCGASQYTVHAGAMRTPAYEKNHILKKS